MASIYTPNLLQGDKGWGAYAAELNLNYAIAHGYKYIMFTRSLITRPGWVFVWNTPLGGEAVLGREEDDCKWLFWLDGDAVVTNVRITLEDRLINPHFGATINDTRDGPIMLASCHTSVTAEDGVSCEGCTCFRATKPVEERVDCRAEYAAITQKYGVQHAHELSRNCLINTGAYFVRNSVRARALFQWWASAGNRKCNLRVATPEQGCIGVQGMAWDANITSSAGPLRVKEAIDMLSASVFNSPGTFEDRYLHDAMALSAKKVWVHKNSTARADPNTGLFSCLRSSAFVCHPWGLDSTAKTAFLREAIGDERRMAALRQMLHARGEEYVHLRQHDRTSQENVGTLAEPKDASGGGV